MLPFRQISIVVFVFIGIFMSLFFMSCQDQVITSSPTARLRFSVDTLSFETIFTGVGSATKTIKIYNPTNNKINIDEISLVDGNQFMVNINGVMTNTLQGVQLRAKDSLTIFVQVFIDATNKTTPFLVKDSIMIQSNTNIDKIILQAYGQDAYRVSKTTIKTDTTWYAEKPYLILDSLIVAENVTLTLEEGVELFFVKKAGMYIKGNMQSKGSLNKKVVFRGDRLDAMFDNLPYDKVPNQWQGIRFYKGSKNNLLQHAIVKNTSWGIVLDSTSLDDTVLKIENSILSNSYENIISATHSVMHISNSVLYNAGKSCLVLQGGSYDIVHTTIANYFAFPWVGRRASSVDISNFVVKEATPVVLPLYKAQFVNSIIYGSWTNEIITRNTFSGNVIDGDFSFNFSHCLLKTRLSDIKEDTHISVIANQTPAFRSTVPYTYEFVISPLSVAIDMADMDVANQYPYDINGILRIVDGKASVGAFHFVGEE